MCVLIKLIDLLNSTLDSSFFPLYMNRSVVAQWQRVVHLRSKGCWLETHSALYRFNPGRQDMTEKLLMWDVKYQHKQTNKMYVDELFKAKMKNSK